MNNIFEGAKFGDKFLTNTGEIAIFNEEDNNLHIYECLIPKHGLINFEADGKNYGDTSIDDIDVVSRYQEPIDEEKLDELARDYMMKTYGAKISAPSTCSPSTIDKYNSYKAGYRKAMEE